MKKILLVSNKVMHYRVSVYNFFWTQFQKENCEFIVRSNEIQKSNENPLRFDFAEIEFEFKKYRDEIIRLNPDVVILFLHLKEKLYWQLAHWLKLRKIPFVYWNKAINHDAPNDRWRNYLFQYMHSLADGIILYSPMEKEYIKKKNWEKLFFANNAINYTEFPEIHDTKEDIKAELSIPFEKIVLFTGRMEIQGGRKKVDHLIQIFNDLDRPDIGLVIVGSGFSKSLASVITSKNIKHLGEVHDPDNILISKIFTIADIFSIPGHIGLGINQAMYFGLPVVTEKGGQPPEIDYLINGETGFLVDNNDIESLKEKIIYLIDNDDARLAFSKKARKHILKVATIEKMYEAFLNCCTMVTSK